MARTPAPHPVPVLGKRGELWRIRWFSKRRLYEITLGGFSKPDAQAILGSVSLALAGKAEWPAVLSSRLPVVHYLRSCPDRTFTPPPASLTATQLTDGYYRHQKAKFDSTWPSMARSYLNRFFGHIGPPELITAESVNTFLDSLSFVDGPRRKRAHPEHKIATRNRVRTALSGFFKWMRITGQRPAGWNPLKKIPVLREHAPADGIVTWEADEIPTLLKLADTLPGGVTIWIAIYTGLGRSEIAKLHWKNITKTTINVYRNKTGIHRQIPLAQVLAERLDREPRTGSRVAPWPEKTNGWIAAARDLLEIHLKKAFRSDRKFAKLPDEHPEKFGWNAFRHTFASRHAQAGLSLELISAWMGNSPAVCRRHYARFVPANRKDTRIDLVDSA